MARRRRGTAVVIRKEKVLLVRDKGKGRFSLPGGGINKGEPTVSAAARELYEELGLRAQKVIRLHHCDFKSSMTEHRVCLIEASGEPRLRGHELNEFIWWDMKTPVPIFGHVTAILGAYRCSNAE
jgi:8-oxo-dGTP pyrophosphatase MutT (NUDIX family)